MEKELDQAAESVIERLEKGLESIKKGDRLNDPAPDIPKLKTDAQASLDRLSSIASAGLDVVALYHSSGTAQMIEDFRVALDRAEEYFAAKELG
jgi:hypothetical protein